jgi:hypothetical protein
LLGIVRHLEWDNFRGPAQAPTPAIDPARRAAIVTALLNLAQQKDPPAGRSAEGHEWFRRRAIEGLTHAGYYKADAEVSAALEALLKDESESLAIRCAAATAVGKMAYQAPVKLEPTPTAKELGYLALLACHKELTRVTELNKLEYDRLSRLQGPSGGGYGGGYGGGMDGGGMDGGGGGGAMMPRPGGGAGNAETYAGPRPGGSVRPGAAGGGMMPDGGMGGGMMGSGMMGGGYGGAQTPADPKQYRFDYIRRRIRGQLYAIEVGLVGPDGFQRYLASQKADNTPVPAGAGGAAATQATGSQRGIVVLAKDKAEKDYVKNVIDGVVKLAKAVENTDTSFADLDKELRKQMKPLESITKKLATAAPAAVPSDLPEMPVIPGIAPPEAPRPEPPAPPAAAPPGAAPPAPAAVTAPCPLML